jgi:succinate-semialdehyde dehydrogenase/glutarate-semialdehyde dehydrogenase
VSSAIVAPDDGTHLGAITPDSDADIDVKVRDASQAMRAWSSIAPMRRAEVLIDIASRARSLLPDLAAALAKEQGKTRREAEMELERFIGPFVQYAGMATHARGRFQQLAPEVTGWVEYGPVGVAAAIVPWNFPASLFGSKAAPALAAGCGFVIKPAETTTLITQRLAAIAAEFLPPGLLSVVVGGAHQGEYLVEHPDIARVAFTGSTPVGRRIGAIAGAKFKRVTLELGGCDPFVVLDGADLHRATRALMGSRFYNAGQVCVAPKRLVVAKEHLDEMVDALTERLGRVRLGRSLDPDTTMGPLHSAAARHRLEEQVADAADRGAVLVGTGRPDEAELDMGHFSRPGLVIAPPAGARVRAEETFGPLLTVIPVADEEQAVAVANETEFALGASVWCADLHRAQQVARRIPSGYTWINAIPRVYDELPFGGVGQSGLGREHGVEALDSYLEPRTFIVT